MNICALIDQQAIAEELIKFGDLYKDGCGRDLDLIHNNEQELHDLIGNALDVVEVFGEAGLRALSNRALVRADEVQVQAKLAEEDAENSAREIALSEYDTQALISAVGSVDGDADAYELAKIMVQRGIYTSDEMMRLSNAQLMHLLS